MSQNRDVRVPKSVVYAALVLALVVVCAAAFLVSAKAATWLLASLFFICGVLHLVIPRGIIPQVRSAVFDALTCFLFGGLLAFFAPWASTPLIF